MSGRIPKSFIDDLVARADIVDIIARRIPLKKAGRDYKACCPFHNEKTPSFHVNPQKNFYHCFGCGAHGDALRFIMDYEHQDFVAAVELLAGEMGLSVPREHVTTQQLAQRQQQQQVTAEGLALLAQVARWFANNLTHHPQGNQAIDYLKHRGITGVMARDFMLGFAPYESTALQRAFPQVTLAQWQAVGLVKVRDQGEPIDRFRQRIMFPIRNERGQVIAFGGRLMQASEHAPKYLNSPETMFFHKSDTLYGLYEMLQHVRHIDRILVVEGYMDVVALVQHGIYNVVATLGTATTPAHLQRLFKYSAEIVFAFDGDAAGRKAAWKALSVALTQLSRTRSVRFFFLPIGEDPDSWVRQQGAEAFMQAVGESLTVSAWLVQGLAELTQLSWQVLEDRQRLLLQAKPLLLQSEDQGVRYTLVQALAVAADMQEWQVERLLEIRTGLAVHRVIKHVTKQAHVPLVAGLPQRLLALLAAFPALAQYWPSEDRDLLYQYGDRALVVLLNVLAGQPMRVQTEAVFLSEAQALQEWQDGWKSLLCQALTKARHQLLSQVVTGAASDALQQHLQQVNQRIRQCQQQN